MTRDEILTALFRDNEEGFAEAVRQCFEDGASPATHCLFFTDDLRLAADLGMVFTEENAAALAVAAKAPVRLLLAGVHASLPSLLDAPAGPDDIRLVMYSDGRFEFETLSAKRFPTQGVQA